MSYRTLKLMVVINFMALFIGCPGPNQPSGEADELRLLTPEQVKWLADNTEKEEKKEMVRQSIKNDKGEVVGNISSQTTVIYLKPGSGRPGGNRFSVNVSCTSSCSGVPTNIDPGNPNNTCAGRQDGCDPGRGGCSACTCPAGCTASCIATKTGAGNFGIFMAMEKGIDPEAVTVAQK